MDDWLHGSIGWRRPVAAIVVLALACVVGVAMLGSSAGRILSTVGSSVGPAGGDTVDGGGEISDEAAQPAGGGTDASTDSAGGGGGGRDAVSSRMLDVARPDLLIIKTGEISIQAADIGRVVDKVTAEMVGIGGYASASTRSGRGQEASASITFRVPADRWEAALALARGAGDQVVDERTETVDATGDVVDLRARIRNLQATETAIEAIMARAGSINDVLDVQSRLSDVRGQIEQLSAKAADLEARAAYSTLTVHVSVRPTPVVARQKPQFDPGHEADAATARLVSLLQRAATLGIWVGIVWLPILAALAVAGAVAFLLARRARRVLGGGPGGATPVPEGGA
jgi:uncharacterized protein DUF4349